MMMLNSTRHFSSWYDPTEEQQPEAGKHAASALVEEVYQKKTQIEHVLLRPDTYIGSVDSQSQLVWVIDDESSKRPKMV